jgi:hypothetical protein
VVRLGLARHRLTAPSPLIRRHLRTGELAFHYCHVPEGQLLANTRLIRAAGLCWPVEEDFETKKDCFGLDQCQARLYTAILRHAVLVMAALAICAVGRPAPEPHQHPGTATARPRPGTAGRPGMIPLTVPKVRRILAALTARPLPPPHVIHWDAWTRRHQARSRWFHQRARLKQDYALVS